MAVCNSPKDKKRDCIYIAPKFGLLHIFFRKMQVNISLSWILTLLYWWFCSTNISLWTRTTSPTVSRSQNLLPRSNYLYEREEKKKSRNKSKIKLLRGYLDWHWIYRVFWKYCSVRRLINVSALWVTLYSLKYTLVNYLVSSSIQIHSHLYSKLQRNVKNLC